jgi:hypothetical protein
MKKEIKKNEFFKEKDKSKDLLIKKEKNFLNKVSSDLKNSIIIQLKSKNEFNFSKQRLLI